MSQLNGANHSTRERTGEPDGELDRIAHFREVFEDERVYVSFMRTNTACHRSLEIAHKPWRWTKKQLGKERAAV